MSAISPRGRTLAVALLATVALSLALSTLGRGQDPKPAPAPAKAAPQLKPAIFGARACAGCHTEPGQYKQDVDAGNFICRLIESKIFAERDKHKDALTVLEGERGRRMGMLLGLADVTTHKACVSCHGVTVPQGVRPQLFDAKAEGVSCVSCHGPYLEWVQRHQFPEQELEPGVTWRDLSRERKERDFGMVDLWDPVTRAAKCVSCHVGNASEGKVVTHAMYAAGHPPLPGIEVATFSDAEPRHWQYLKEKSPKIQKRLNYEPEVLEQTQLVAVSGLVPLRESLRLFADQAARGGLVDEPKTTWPDFARFDCYACHHDLQAPGYAGWRQRRGFADAPGRPPAPTWPAILVDLGVTAASADKATARAAEFDQKLAAFHQALGKRPFGDATTAIPAARDLADWADAVLGDLDDVKVNRSVALRLLRRLAEKAQATIPDYDTARQMTWAFRAIYHEIETKPDSRVEAILQALGEQLLIPLPSAGEQEPIEKTLAQRMEVVARYDPKGFQQRFAELVKLLPAE